MFNKSEKKINTCGAQAFSSAPAVSLIGYFVFSQISIIETFVSEWFFLLLFFVVMLCCNSVNLIPA